MLKGVQNFTIQNAYQFFVVGRRSNGFVVVFALKPCQPFDRGNLGVESCQQRVIFCLLRDVKHIDETVCTACCQPVTIGRVKPEMRIFPQ